MAQYDGIIVRTCLGCGARLHEGEYATVHFSDPALPSWGYYCKNKCEPVAESRPALVGNCLVCDIELYEGDEYTNIPTVAAGSKIWPGLYCKNCRVDGKSKEEARVTLSEVLMMVAKHYAALVPFVDRDLVYSLTRDYHAHLLSIATVGNLPEEPTESGDDKWISVHDMMPKEGDSVLIWLHDAAPHEAEGVNVATWLSMPRHTPAAWRSDHNTRFEGLVTHWQLLPSKPKGLE